MIFVAKQFPEGIRYYCGTNNGEPDWLAMRSKAVKFTTLLADHVAKKVGGFVIDTSPQKNVVELEVKNG